MDDHRHIFTRLSNPPSCSICGEFAERPKRVGNSALDKEVVFRWLTPERLAAAINDAQIDGLRELAWGHDLTPVARRILKMLEKSGE